MDTITWTDLSAVLAWIATGPGVAAIIGAVASYLAENVAAWHDLPARAKTIVMIVASFALPVLAQAFLEQADAIARVQPVWALAINGFIAWWVSQETYLRQKRLQS